VTSVLVPWNTCGAYISGVLGVATGTYLPYCFFNILSPTLDIVYGFIGFKVPTVSPAESGGEALTNGTREVTDELQGDAERHQTRSRH
jgi:Na+:H+ antiporter, NhaC family